MMKKIIILFIITIITIKVMAQEVDSLYLESLKQHLAYLNDVRKGEDLKIFLLKQTIR